MNNKALHVENLKIIDQVPVSEDPELTVNLVSPSLGVPGEGFDWGAIGGKSGISTASGGEPKVPPPVSVAPGVVAQWHGADEPGFDVEALGEDGVLEWVCAVPGYGQTELVLLWDVAAPVKTTVVGLSRG